MLPLHPKIGQCIFLLYCFYYHLNPLPCSSSYPMQVAAEPTLVWSPETYVSYVKALWTDGNPVPFPPQHTGNSVDGCRSIQEAQSPAMPPRDLVYSL